MQLQGWAAGIVSLRFGGTETFPQVELVCIVGVDTADAPVELSALAQSLADSWAAARQLDCRVAYVGRCAAWNQLASVAA